ncbi:unnamed protein product [Lupinus luteus]|uniref:Ribosomal protein L34Ae n=1 Tax=Lupinus luteus TaxID=3873 RepID=A0AAV1X9I9_LUPLU
MLWPFGFLSFFICNYVLYSLGLILRYLFRFGKVRDAEKELPKPESQTDVTERDYEIDGFREELANFLLWSGNDDDGAFKGSGEREGNKESSVFNVPEDSEILEGEKACFIFKEIHTDVHEDNVKTRVYTEFSFSKENTHEYCVERRKEDESVSMDSDSSNSVFHEYAQKSEMETEDFVVIETNSNFHTDCKKNVEVETEKETGDPFFIESESNVHEDSKNVEEAETESSVLKQSESVFMQSNSHLNEDNKKIEEDKEEGPIFVETNTATTTSMCQYMSGKDVISGFIEQPTAMSFSFREFFMSPSVSPVYNNACASTDIIHNKVFPEIGTEKKLIALEEKEKLFQFKSNGFCGTDSSDEENFPFNENLVESDFESESSTSSGLIWGNNFEDSFAYQILASNEGFESELFKLIMKEERTDILEEKQFSCSGKVSAEDTYIEMESGVEELKSLNGYSFHHKDQQEGLYNEEVACMKDKSEEKLCESEDDEENENDYEWEHEDLVGQLKMELKYARQGGLATILEEEEEIEEEEDLEVESPKVVLDLKPLKIEEKLDYKDQMAEIEHVYMSYTEKMKKLDILNCQTMHALGLLQLKDPLKLISMPKSTNQGAKPLISQNVWPCKASKNTSDPLFKIVTELHRDLELVYIGQVCLSWEILCWQHKKAQELQQFHSQGCRYNHVAGEFQLFQVLMNRFIENEPFQQGTRIQNYVKNRCVIRNLLQVPAIKDDTMKDKNITKDDDAIASGRLEGIIKESMSVFWEFVRADKDYGNVILKASQHVGIDLKDPAISGLLVDIRTQLHKKERKVKDIVRSGNCIVRKFQKHHEDQLDHEQIVAQVGLKLISRVLNMSKLRKEQVLWCHEKLHRIKFITRKIVQVEPSFLLFPC